MVPRIARFRAAMQRTMDSIEAPFKIIGEVNGIPIKRYARSARNPVQTPRAKRTRALKYLSPQQQKQVKASRLQRLSPFKKAAYYSKQGSKAAAERIAKLKAQRLSVLGPRDHTQRISEAQTPFVHGDVTLHKQDHPGERRN